MRTTVDIDDAVYSDLKGQAARERTSVKALIERAVCRMLHDGKVERASVTRPPWPSIPSSGGAPIEVVSNDFALFGADDE